MDYLGNDEKVIMTYRLHWVTLIGSILLIFPGIAFVFPPAFGIYGLLKWWYNKLVLTNQAFYIRMGIISRDITRIPLKSIQDISFDQGFWGRIFGFGTVVVRSAALGGIGGYKYMANPQEMTMAISQAIENANQIQVNINTAQPPVQYPPPYPVQYPQQYPQQPPMNQYPNQPPVNQAPPQQSVNQLPPQPPTNQLPPQPPTNTNS